MNIAAHVIESLIDLIMNVLFVNPPALNCLHARIAVPKSELDKREAAYQCERRKDAKKKKAA